MERHVMQSISNQTLFVIVGITFGLCSVLYYGMNRAAITQDVRRHGTKGVVAFAVLTGLVSLVASVLVYQKAIGMASISNVHVVTALAFAAPLVTTLISFFFFKQRLGAASVIGVCLIVAGGLLLTMAG